MSTAAAPAARPTAADPRWARILARDAGGDGAFWYVVATTGVYCRPSCPSRAANPDNVTICDTLAQARATGARACRRCNPDGLAPAAQTAAIVERACRTIERAESVPTLAMLADAAELSPAYFSRLFKAATGVTPRGYALAHRARRVRRGLREAASVTAAIHDAGYGAASRFYEGAGKTLGMSPAAYRAGGAGETLRFAVGDSSLGAVLVASSATGVAAILLGDDPAALIDDLARRFPRAVLVGGDAGYEALVARVIALVEEPRAAAAGDLPLDVRGTAFQQRVWQALRAVPAGETVSYRELARRIGAPAATRAVAGACAANPLAVAVPCHRVVRADGGLSGYRWGIERKRTLLAREAAATPPPSDDRATAR